MLQQLAYRFLPSANFLITAGIITKDLVEIFTPPDAKIPTGRKWPLRTKQKACVITSQEVIDDLQSHQQEIDARNARTEAVAQRTSRGSSNGDRRLNSNNRQKAGDCSNQLTAPSRTMQVRRTLKQSYYKNQ